MAFGNILRKEQIKKEMELISASCFNLTLTTVVLSLRRCVCEGTGEFTEVLQMPHACVTGGCATVTVCKGELLFLPFLTWPSDVGS